MERGLAAAPRFTTGEAVRVLSRPSSHGSRIPTYLRGCRGVIECLVFSDVNDKKGGNNKSLTAYRVMVPMSDLFPNYTGCPRDDLHLEICEAWLERVG